MVEKHISSQFDAELNRISTQVLEMGGVVESQAPDGTPLDLVVGTVVASPLGPQGITFAGTVPAQTATVGQPFSLDLAAYFGEYYPVLAFALVAGSLAGSGLALSASTGVISGTPTGAVVLAGLTVAATDATDLSAQTNPFTVTVT